MGTCPWNQRAGKKGGRLIKWNRKEHIFWSICQLLAGPDSQTHSSSDCSLLLHIPGQLGWSLRRRGRNGSQKIKAEHLSANNLFNKLPHLCTVFQGVKKFVIEDKYQNERGVENWKWKSFIEINRFDKILANDISKILDELLEKESKSYPRLCSSWGNSGAHPEWRITVPQVPSVLPLMCWHTPSSCWDGQHMKPYCHFCSHPLKPSWSQVPGVWPLEYSVTPATLHSPYASHQYFSPHPNDGKLGSSPGW